MPVTSETGNRGFTLLELLVVLTILVLLAGAWPLAAPKLFPTQQLRNEVQILASHLRAARTTARASGSEQRIDIPSSGTSYRAASETHDLPAGLHLRIGGPTNAASPGGIVFYPDGSSTGATLELARPHRLVVIRVGRLTGRTEIIE